MTEKQENGNKANGNEAELVRGLLLINPRSAPYIACMSDLEMFAEKEPL